MSAPLSAFTVTTSCAASPTSSAATCATVILRTAGARTTSVAVPRTVVSAVAMAVMVVVPEAIVVTRPSMATVTTVLLPERHVTVRAKPLSAVTVAASVRDWPTSSVSAVGATVTLRTRGTALTVMVLVSSRAAAVRSVARLVAIMSAVPGDTAVTVPVLSMVATAAVLLRQLTRVSIPASPATVAESVRV